MNKQYFKDLELIRQINQDIVEKEREKNHSKTSPRKRAQLDGDLKQLYQQRKDLTVKLNSYHAQTSKKRH